MNADPGVHAVDGQDSSIEASQLPTNVRSYVMSQSQRLEIGVVSLEQILLLTRLGARSLLNLLYAFDPHPAEKDYQLECV